MFQRFATNILIALAFTGLASAGVTTTQPANGASVGSSVHFVASANSPYAGIAAMVINVDSRDVYTVYASQIDTYLSLSAGQHQVYVKAWDNTNHYFDQVLSINVGGTSGNGTPSPASQSATVVNVTAPLDGSTVGGAVRITATAGGAPSAIGAMLINVDSQNVYQVNGGAVDTTVNLGAGTHQIYVKAWDVSGHYFDKVLNVTVSGGSGGGNGTPSPASHLPNVVTVTSPADGSTSPNAVHVAAATGGAPAAIGAMMVNVDSQNVYQVAGGALDTTINLANGNHQIYVKAWDTLGNYYDKVLNIAVSGNGTPTPQVSTAISNIEKMSGWASCGSCAMPGGVGYDAPRAIVQGIANPSLDGSATQFWLGGNNPYSNALFFNALGPYPNANDFTLDFNFYMQDATVSQGFEMDIFYVRDGKKNYFLTECDSRGTYAGTWQVSNATADQWQHTGLPCHIQSWAWNHVTLQFHRNSDGSTQFVSVAMNGDTQYVNRSYPAEIVSAGQSGMNVGIQLDGDERQDNYSVWIDNLTIHYW